MAGVAPRRGGQPGGLGHLRRVEAAGLALADAGLPHLEAEWQSVKAAEREAPSPVDTRSPE